MNGTPPAGISDAVALLRALDLTEIAVSASIAADGRLEGVGGLTDKIDAATARQREYGRLHGLLLATAQPDLQELRKRRGEAIPILDASDFESAILELSMHSAPRRVVAEQSPSTFRIFGVHHPVTFDRYYQQLPLLKRVEPERLPGFGKEDGWFRPDGDGRLRNLVLERWDDYVSGDHAQYDEVHLEQVLDEAGQHGAPRFFLIGPPGSGKSTVLAFIAYRCVETDHPLRIRTKEHLPVQISLPAWQEWSAHSHSHSLPEYLAHHYREQQHGPSTAQWQHWLRSGSVLLLLDGLDELDMRSSLHNLGLPTLLRQSDYARCPLIISCRSIIYQEHRRLAADLPVYKLGGMSHRQQADFIRQYPSERPGFDAEALVTELRGGPNLQPLAANPLLLSIICLVASGRDGTNVPARRWELYERAVEQLLVWGEERKLQGPSEPGITYPGEDAVSGRLRPVAAQYPPGVEPALEQKQQLLEELALQLWVDKENLELLFDGHTVLRVLEVVLRRKGFSRPSTLAACLIADWVHNSGLLRRVGRRYAFLHLTVQEFLVGQAMARRIGAVGWERASLSVSGKRKRTQHLLQERIRDPQWQEIFPFLAGGLNAPHALFSIFPGAAVEMGVTVDPFHDTLFLAARCAAEVPDDRLDSSLSQTIVERLVALLCSCSENDQGRAFKALASTPARRLQGMLDQAVQDNDPKVRLAALSALGLADGRAALSYLRQGLDDLESDVRSGVLPLLVLIGTSEAVAIAEKSLADDSDDVRRTAVATLAAMDLTETLPLIRSALSDRDFRVQEAAIQAVAEARDREALPVLANLMDSGGYSADSAATAVGQIGGSDAEAILVERLQEDNPQMCIRVYAGLKASGIRATRLTLERMAAQAAGWASRTSLLALANTGEKSVLALLEALAGDSDPRVRCDVADALGILGGDEAAELLRKMLRDEDPWVIERVVAAIGVTATAPLGPFLEPIIRATDESLRREAVVALGKGGSVRDISIVGDLLLHDSNRDVRCAAAEALGEMQHDDAVRFLDAALDDRDQGVRWRAVQALGKHAGPSVLPALQRAVHDREEGVQKAAIEALGHCRSMTVLPILRAILKAPNEEIHCAAAEALGAIGGSESASILVDALHRASGEVQSSIIRALARLGDPAASNALADALCSSHAVTRSATWSVINEPWTVLEAESAHVSFAARVQEIGAYFPASSVYDLLAEIPFRPQAYPNHVRRSIIDLSCRVWADGLAKSPSQADLAESLYLTALRDGIDPSGSALSLAQLLSAWPGRETDAIDVLERYCLSEQSNSDGWYLYGRSHWLAGNTERALNAYAHGFAVEKDIFAWASALRTCASLCLELGDPARAKALLDEAARHESYVEDFEERLMRVIPNDPWSAVGFWQEALEYTKQRHQHHLLRAEVALVESRSDAAMQVLDRPWGVDWDQAESHFLFGLVLLARGQLSEAEAAYDEGLSFANNWTDVLAAIRKLDHIHEQCGGLVGTQIIRQRLSDAEFRLKAGWPPAHQSGRPFEAEHSL